jgi:hypothetical protein
MIEGEKSNKLRTAREDSMEVDKLVVYLPDKKEFWKARVDCEKCGVSFDGGIPSCWAELDGKVMEWVGVPFKFWTEA